MLDFTVFLRRSIRLKLDSILNVLYGLFAIITARRVPKIQSFHLHLGFGLLDRLWIRQAGVWSVFDNKDTVDLIQTQTCGLDVEEPDERQPSSVEDGKYDVKPPPYVLYACEMVSAPPKPK